MTGVLCKVNGLYSTRELWKLEHLGIKNERVGLFQVQKLDARLYCN